MTTEITSVREELKSFQSSIERRVSEIENYASVSGKGIEVKAVSAATDSAFSNYVKSASGFPIESKSTNPQDGGFVINGVTEETLKTIMNQHSVIRNIANVQEISNDSMEIVVDASGSNALWYNDDEPTSTPEKKLIQTYELIAQPKVSHKLIDDMPEVEQFILSQIADKFVRKESAAFVSGDGNGKPRGFLTYSDTEISQVSGSLNYASISSLVASLDNSYLSGACFLVNQSSQQIMQNIQDSNGHFIYQNSVNGSNATVLGFPVYVSSDMPSATSGKLAVAFGNFNLGYQIVQKTGVRTIKDPFTSKPFVKFYTVAKVGGDVTDKNAIKLLKIA